MTNDLEVLVAARDALIVQLRRTAGFGTAAETMKQCIDLLEERMETVLAEMRRRHGIAS
jgi:hypothetical protein